MAFVSHLQFSRCFKLLTHKPIVLVVWHVYWETLNKYCVLMVKILLHCGRNLILIPCTQKLVACDIYNNAWQYRIKDSF